MMTLKGLPLAYNKDYMQEDEGLFDALDTGWTACRWRRWCWTASVKRPRCQEAAEQGYANATELADYPSPRACRSEAHHRRRGGGEAIRQW